LAFLVFLLFSLWGLSSSLAISIDRSIADLDLAKYTTEEQVSSLFQLWRRSMDGSKGTRRGKKTWDFQE